MYIGGQRNRGKQIFVFDF